MDVLALWFLILYLVNSDGWWPARKALQKPVSACVCVCVCSSDSLRVLQFVPFQSASLALFSLSFSSLSLLTLFLFSLSSHSSLSLLTLFLFSLSFSSHSLSLLSLPSPP